MFKPSHPSPKRSHWSGCLTYAQGGVSGYVNNGGFESDQAVTAAF